MKIKQASLSYRKTHQRIHVKGETLCLVYSCLYIIIIRKQMTLHMDSVYMHCRPRFHGRGAGGQWLTMFSTKIQDVSSNIFNFTEHLKHSLKSHTQHKGHIHFLSLLFKMFLSNHSILEEGAQSEILQVCWFINWDSTICLMISSS